MIELDARVVSLQESNQQFQEDVQTKDGLIQRLEEDLSRNRDFTSSASSATASAATVSAPRAEDAGVAGSDEPRDQRMLEIVSAQRDRFKTRISTLEHDNLTLMNQIKSLQADSRALRDDNVKLYQKIKYLQSYGNIAKERGNDVRFMCNHGM